MKRTIRNYNMDKGITIVSLLITIVLLIIISAVSIGAMYDNDGMVEQAEKVQNTTNIKLLEKQIKQDILTEQLNTGYVTNQDIKNILTKYTAVFNESENKIIIENGKYQILLEDFIMVK